MLHPLNATASNIIKEITNFKNEYFPPNYITNTTSSCNINNTTDIPNNLNWTSTKYTNVYDPDNPSKESGNNKTGIFIDDPSVPPAGPDGNRNVTSISTQRENKQPERSPEAQSPEHFPDISDENFNIKNINNPKFRNDKFKKKHFRNRIDRIKIYDKRYNHLDHEEQTRPNGYEGKVKNYEEDKEGLQNDSEETSMSSIDYKYSQNILNNNNNLINPHNNDQGTLGNTKNAKKHFFRNRQKKKFRKKKQREINSRDFVKKHPVGASIQQLQHKRNRRDFTQ